MDEQLYDFGAALLDPERAIPNGVVGPDGVPSSRRFAVYRNNVVASLIDVLAAGYPAIQRLVGEQFFRAMARIFVAQHPPQSPVMLEYGEEFPDFIDGFPPASSVPYLADVARLECAWLDAYHAPDATPCTPQAFSTVPPDLFAGAVLILHPSTHLFRSPFPAVDIWQMNVANGAPAPVDLSKAQDVLISRPGAKVEVRVLDRDSASFLHRLQQGASVSDAALALFARNPRFDLVSNLTGLIALGLVTGWVLDQESATSGDMGDADCTH